ncbi:MAG TPA: hypothetical protein VKM55_25370 [Candidatus Lokiarchaeia archaeon]|nr:hypothetical protein [Candidatus Lokiarchaeia archaeon]
MLPIEAPAPRHLCILELHKFLPDLNALVTASTSIAFVTMILAAAGENR